MPASDPPLPFISTVMLNTEKLDPSKVALSTIIDYISKRNGARNMSSVQLHSTSICLPKNFPSTLRLSQNDINEKRQIPVSASKNQEELDSKMKKNILPKIHPPFLGTAPIKQQQNTKKNKLRTQATKALLDDFRQNMKAIKSVMNPERSSKVVQSEHKAMDSRKRIIHEEVHIFSPFSGAKCKRADKIKLMVTGNSYPKTLVNIMNKKTKLTAEQAGRPTFAGSYF